MPVSVAGQAQRKVPTKLYLSVDTTTFSVVAHTLTEQNVDDPSQVAPLSDQIEAPIAQVTADGTYDGAPVGGNRTTRQPDTGSYPSAVNSSPRKHRPIQRNRHLACIREQGRLVWQKAVRYGKRALVETIIARYKTLIGPRLRAQSFAMQKTEAAIRVAMLNRLLAVARPQGGESRLTRWRKGDF